MASGKTPAKTLVTQALTSGGGLLCSWRVPDADEDVVAVVVPHAVPVVLEAGDWRPGASRASRGPSVIASLRAVSRHHRLSSASAKRLNCRTTVPGWMNFH